MNTITLVHRQNRKINMKNWLNEKKKYFSRTEKLNKDKRIYIVYPYIVVERRKKQ